MAQLDEMQERLAQMEEVEEKREATFKNELERRFALREEEMIQQFAWIEREMEMKLIKMEEAEEKREAIFESELETRLALKEEEMAQQFAWIEREMEMKIIKREEDLKLELREEMKHEMNSSISKALRDLPYLMTCGFRYANELKCP